MRLGTYGRLTHIFVVAIFLLFSASCQVNFDVGDGARFMTNDGKADKFYKLAEESFKKKDYRKTVDLCRETLKYQPSHAFAFNLRGKARMELQEYEDALVDFSKAARLNPENPEFYVNGALVYFVNRWPERALELIEKAVELDPSRAETLAVKGLIHMQEGEYENALTALNKAVLEEFDNADYLYLRSRCHLRFEEYDKDLKDLEQALKFNKDLVQAYKGIGQAYYYKGDNDKALEYLDKALKIDPEYGMAYSLKGMVYQKKKEYDKAEECFLKAVEKKRFKDGFLGYERYTTDFKFDADDYHSLGFINLDQKQYKAALDYFKKDNADVPDRSCTYSHMAKCYRELGEKRDALRCYMIVKDLTFEDKNKDEEIKARYNEADEFEKKYNETFLSVTARKKALNNPEYNKALNLVKAGRFEAAEKTYREIIRKDPQNQYVHSDLAYIYMEIGELSLAMKHLRKAYKIEPGRTKMLTNYSNLYLRMKEYDKAIKYANLAFKKDDRNFLALINRASAEEALGNDDRAIEDLSKIIELRPDFHLGYFRRGFLYLKRSDEDKAIKDFEKSIYIKHEFSPAYYYLGEALLIKKRYIPAEKNFIAFLRLDGLSGRYPKEIKRTKEVLSQMKLKKLFDMSNDGK